jgi:hypothetical protein
MAGHRRPQLPGDREARRLDNVLHHHVNQYLNADTPSERYRAARNWLDTVARYGSREVVNSVAAEMLGLAREAWTEPTEFAASRTMPAEWQHHLPAPVHVPGRVEKAVTRIASAAAAVQQGAKSKPRRRWW